ncbi:hypothetical protein [Rhizobium leguminosarum]|uniref:hypothetical protein n=1 Tax=Rhizobium leguminosarum TaxID=384 RepID=UPI003ECD6136
MSRWIRVQTSIFDHELFFGKEFSELDAWLWLIAKAAWRDTTHRIGSVVIAVPIGSLFTTLRELQRAWRWGSDYRVRSFLKVLENERMIVTNSNAGKTQITICNYKRFQNPERTENADETQPETQEKRTENALKTPVIPFHQNFERERGRENDLDFDGFKNWFASWPTSLTDDDVAARSQWEDLTDEQRAAAKAETPMFIEGVKASGRKTWPPAAKFLAQRMWERVWEKPQTKPKRGRGADIAAIVAGITDAEDLAGAQPPSKTAEEIRAERQAARIAYLKEAIENNKRHG